MSYLLFLIRDSFIVFVEMVKTKVTPRLALVKEVKLVVKEECPLCKKEFQDENGLKNHVLMCAKENSGFTCFICKKMFKKNVYLRRHMRKFHQHKDVRVIEIGEETTGGSSRPEQTQSDDDESELSDPGDLKELIGDISETSSSEDDNISQTENVGRNTGTQEHDLEEGRVVRKPTTPQRVLAPIKRKYSYSFGDKSQNESAEPEEKRPEVEVKEQDQCSEETDINQNKSDIKNMNCDKNNAKAFKDKEDDGPEVNAVTTCEIGVQVDICAYKKLIKTVEKYVENNKNVERTTLEEYYAH